MDKMEKTTMYLSFNPKQCLFLSFLITFSLAMLKVGNKIRKIRELKNIAPKDMAEKLGMTVQGYTKIERDETSLNLERLEQISTLFEMKPEDVISFDEKNVFNNYGEIKGGHQLNNGIINFFPEEMKQLYEDKIRLLEEKIRWLEGK